MLIMCIEIAAAAAGAATASASRMRCQRQSGFGDGSTTIRPALPSNGITSSKIVTAAPLLTSKSRESRASAGATQHSSTERGWRSSCWGGGVVDGLTTHPGQLRVRSRRAGAQMLNTGVRFYGSKRGMEATASTASTLRRRHRRRCRRRGRRRRRQRYSVFAAVYFKRPARLAHTSGGSRRTRQSEG